MPASTNWYSSPRFSASTTRNVASAILGPMPSPRMTAIVLLMKRDAPDSKNGRWPGFPCRGRLIRGSCVRAVPCELNAAAIWRCARDARQSTPGGCAQRGRRTEAGRPCAGDHLNGVRVAAHYPEMPLRCTRRMRFALAALVAGAAAPAAAGVMHVSLETAFAPVTYSHPIAIEGSAPAGCVPKVARILLDGTDISVELTAPATGCKQHEVPFHLTADAAATAGLRVLPPAVYRVHVYSG